MCLDDASEAERDLFQRRHREPAPRRCEDCKHTVQRCAACAAVALLRRERSCAVCHEFIVDDAELAALSAAVGLQRRWLIATAFGKIYAVRFERVLNWRYKKCPKCDEVVHRDKNATECLFAIAAHESAGRDRPRAFQYTKPVRSTRATPPTTRN